jgi:hypothetical protein
MARAYGHEVHTWSASPQSRKTGPSIRSSGMTAAGLSVGAGLSNSLVYGSGLPSSIQAAVRQRG